MATLKNDIEKNEETFQGYYQPSSMSYPNYPMYSCPYYTASSFSEQAMRGEDLSFDEYQTSDIGFRQRRPRRRRRRRRPSFPIRPFIIRPFFIRPFYPPYMYPYYDYDYDYDDDDYDWD